MPIEYIDEGPSDWKAGRSDITCVQKLCAPLGECLILPGASEEHNWRASCGPGRGCGKYSKGEWERFLASLRLHGMMSHVLVFKERDGTVHVWEGNHRLAAARQLGWECVPVEVRYFGNSQRDGLVFEEDE